MHQCHSVTVYLKFNRTTYVNRSVFYIRVDIKLYYQPVIVTPTTAASSQFQADPRYTHGPSANTFSTSSNENTTANMMSILLKMFCTIVSVTGSFRLKSMRFFIPHALDCVAVCCHQTPVKYIFVKRIDAKCSLSTYICC